MTLQQRERLYFLVGKIEGLTWGVENTGIADGFCSVAEDLGKLLKEDAEQSETIGESCRSVE